MKDVNDRTELEYWLAGESLDVRQIIAARAALRVLPGLAGELRISSRPKEISNQVLLSVFRAAALAWAISRYPSRGSLVGVAKRAYSALDKEIQRFENASAHFAVRSARYAVQTIFTNHIGSAVDAVTIAANAAGAGSFLFDNSPQTDRDYARLIGTADLWKEVQRDRGKLDESGVDGLTQIQLWLGGRPAWITESWAVLKRILLHRDRGWQLWTDWYEARLEGQQSYPDLTDKQCENLEVARATIPEWIWEEGPPAVFAEIRRLETESSLPETYSWDFFVSYSKEDEATARKIAAVIESDGYEVFSQFQNMTAGANFVREIQTGLAASARFIAVLSPSYELSDHCQAEWSAAYNADPSGRGRKMVPFLIRPTNLNPLARQIVYTSLIGLSDQAAAEKILSAVGPPIPMGPLAIRRKLADAVSPEPQILDNRRIGIGPNETYDTPVLDAELPRLPGRQRANINTLLAKIGQNNSARMVVSALENYRDELDAFGTNPSLGLLNDQVAIIIAESEADRDELWYSTGVKTAFEIFKANHSLIRTHYPLDPEREQAISAAPVSGEIIGRAEFIELHEEYVRSVKGAVDKNIATHDYWRATEKRARLLKDIDSLPDASAAQNDGDIFIDSADRIQPPDVGKRFAVQEGAFLDSLLQRTANVTTIADSEVGKMLLGAAKKLTDYIWSGTSG